MSTRGDTSPRLSPSLAGRIDEACDHFESAWRAGSKPRIEDALATARGPEVPALFRELLALEIELRQGAREKPEKADYLDRFPEHAAMIEEVLAATSTLLGEPYTLSGVRPRLPVPEIPGFEVLGELGRGGMGVVYKARQRRLNRPCALKMILAGAHAAAETSMRFLAEAETVARLRHPSIVQIYSLGDHEGHPYVELEYVEGGSLADRLDGTPWSSREAARVVETLALAIDAAHRQGVVHRDLKPANVLLTADGKPKITDFGLAKTLDSDPGLTRSGAILGTPSYMAPEQAAGKTKDVTPASDVYSLGAILYELVTGRPPFKAAVVLQTLEQIRSSEPVPPSRLQPGLPRDLETVAMKCLQKEPAKRYESAAALGEDLRRFLAGESVLARRVGPGERAWRWCLRNPAVAGLAASVFALLLAVAFGSTLAAVRLNDSARRERTLAGAASLARNRAVEQAEESRKRLVQLNLSEAMRLIDDDDLYGGLSWLVEASRLDQGDPRAEALHRDRLAVVLGRCPRLIRFWSQPSRPLQVAFSPDGRRIAAAGEDGGVRVWDAATGREVCAWALGHRPTFVVFSADGRRLVTASAPSGGDVRSEVRVWDGESGRPLGDAYPQAGRAFHLAFSPDARRVVVAASQLPGDPLEGQGEARVIDAETGKPLGGPIATGGPTFYASFSPDGRRVATACLSRARVWDAETGRPVSKPIQHDGFVEYAEFSPDGRRLLTSCHGEWARVWDASTGDPVTPKMVHGGGLPRARFSPDGRRVLTANNDQAARVWDAATGHPLTPFLPHEGPVIQADFDPDGRRVVTTSWDQTARVWDAGTGRAAGPPLRHTGAVLAARFGADGRNLTTVSNDGTFRSWDTASGSAVPPLIHEAPLTHAEFSPDGRRVVTASRDGSARVWDAANGEPVTRPLRHAGRWVVHAAFSPDGRRVVSAGLDRTARVWDADTGRPAFPPLQHPDRVGLVAFSRDGRLILTLCGDPETRVGVWDATTGRAVGPMIRQRGLHHAEFSPDGRRVVTAGEDGRTVVWDAATSRPTGPTIRQEQPVYHATFSPDGRKIATAGEDRTARVWDAESGRPVAPPMRHQGFVSQVAFSPDGRRLLSAGSDGSARVWDVATGRPTTPPMRHKGPVEFVAYSRDGRRVVSGSQDGTARVWDAETGQPLSPLMRHQGVIRSVGFSPDGRLALTSSADGTAVVWGSVRAPDVGTGLDLNSLARLIAGREIGPDGDLITLPPVASSRLWQSLRLTRPDAFVTTPEEVAAWHRREAREDERRQLWPAALAHLDAALSVKPDSWHLHWLRAGILKRLGKADDAAAALGRVVALKPDDDPAWDEFRMLQIGRRSWDEAAAGYEKRLTARPSNDDYFEYAAVLCLRGDVEGLRSLSRTLADRYGDPTDPRDAYLVARASSLTPGSEFGSDRERAVRWAERAVASRSPSACESLHVSGLSLYRAGRFVPAIRRLEESIASRPDWDGNALNRLLLGMAHSRLNNSQKARRWFDRAGDPPDSTTRGAAQHSLRPLGGRIPAVYLELLVLERESLHLRPPAIPEDPADVFATPAARP